MKAVSKIRVEDHRSKNKQACFYSRWLLLIGPDAITSVPSPCDVFETTLKKLCGLCGL